jgi:protein-S-isoprenylcysteine O-methyltransferase Ste14
LTRKAAHTVGLPRSLALFVVPLMWLVGVPLAHAAAPWVLSMLTPRYGWTADRPGSWNLLGLLPMIVGVAILVWVLVEGLSRTPARVELGLPSSFLVRSGPYEWTRNPMYIAELLVWFGWTVLFGSLVVAAAFLTMLGAMATIVVPREERALEARFGPAYGAYKESVPRWVGRARA